MCDFCACIIFIYIYIYSGEGKLSRGHLIIGFLYYVLQGIYLISSVIIVPKFLPEKWGISQNVHAFLVHGEYSISRLNSNHPTKFSKNCL